METAIAIMAVTFLGEVATLKILMQWFLVMHRSSYHNSVPSHLILISTKWAEGRFVPSTGSLAMTI